MKRLYRFSVIILLQYFFFFGIVSCQKQEFFDDRIDLIDQEIHEGASFTQDFKIETVTLKSLPKSALFVKDLKKKTKTKGDVLISLNNISVVSDNNNHINYTIPFLFEDTKPGTFYNLILAYDGKELVSKFINKYEVEKSNFQEFLDSGGSFNHFKGKIKSYRISDFFDVDLGEILNKDVVDSPCPTQYDAVGDPISCEESSYDGTGSGGGSTGGGSTGGGSTGGDGVGCYLVFYEVRCSCANHGINDECSCVAQGGINDPYIDYYQKCPPTKSKQKTSTDSCEDCNATAEGGVAINTYPVAVQKVYTIMNEAGVILSKDEVDFLYQNSLFTSQILTFFAENTGNIESVNFAQEAIGVLMDDGEVDFVNEIIKDKSFVGTKADCILNALITQGNNIFRKTSEAFTNNRSKFKLKFTLINEPSNIADAQTPFPDSNSNGIITIEVNEPVISGSNYLDYAKAILHETIHAELHRLKIAGNLGPNPIPSEQYNLYMYMWDFYEEVNSSPNYIATQSQHYLMAQYYIDNIAKGLWEFNQFQANMSDYKHLAWEGLNSYGIQGKFITQNELDNLSNMYSNVPKNSDPCN